MYKRVGVTKKPADSLSVAWPLEEKTLRVVFMNIFDTCHFTNACRTFLGINQLSGIFIILFQANRSHLIRDKFD